MGGATGVLGVDGLDVIGTAATLICAVLTDAILDADATVTVVVAVAVAVLTLVDERPRAFCLGTMVGIFRRGAAVAMEPDTLG